MMCRGAAGVISHRHHHHRSAVQSCCCSCSQKMHAQTLSHIDQTIIMFNCDASLAPLAPFECPSAYNTEAPPLQSPNKYCYIGRYKSFTHQSNEMKSNSRHAKAGRNFRDTILFMLALYHPRCRRYAAVHVHQRTTNTKYTKNSFSLYTTRC